MMNPFTPTKFEWESNPQIWLSPTARSISKNMKPVYISGNRGSGKTTALRSLSTKLILESEFLRNQFGIRNFYWFGLYLQFNRNLQFYTDGLASSVNASASATQPKISDAEIFAKYFEVSLLASFLREVQELEAKSHLHTKGSGERLACKELEAIFGECNIPGVRKIDDFSDARRLCNKLLDIFLMRDFDYSAQFVRRTIQAFSIGRLIRFIKEFAIPALASQHIKSGGEVSLFILLDDCESLSLEQQIALNTYIRLTEGDAKWVVSYLSGQFNTVDTTLPNTTLTEADRQVTSLSGMSDSDFQKFCEHVADIRLHSFLDDTRARQGDRLPPSFSFDRFGGFSYNALLEEALKGSQSSAIRRFRTDVSGTKSLLQRVLPKSSLGTFHSSDEEMPYIEHVVIKELSIKVQDFVQTDGIPSLVKQIARKQAAAVIFTCDMLNRNPIYGGKNVVSLFADTTIRDFLDLMGAMWDTVGPARTHGASAQSMAARVRYFLNDRTLIPLSAQNLAIRRAASEKAESVEALVSSTEPHIAYFVKGIGHLTRALHSKADRPKALRVPERGIFRVNVEEVDGIVRKVTSDHGFLDMLARMERDGFLKVVDSPKFGSPFAKFRLHRRLCPYFECSPRGAYETVSLSVGDLHTLMSLRSEAEMESWANSWVQVSSTQSELPFGDLG